MSTFQCFSFFSFRKRVVAVHYIKSMEPWTSLGEFITSFQKVASRMYSLKGITFIELLRKCVRGALKRESILFVHETMNKSNFTNNSLTPCKPATKKRVERIGEIPMYMQEHTPLNYEFASTAELKNKQTKKSCAPAHHLCLPSLLAQPK